VVPDLNLWSSGYVIIDMVDGSRFYLKDMYGWLFLKKGIAFAWSTCGLVFSSFVVS